MPVISKELCIILPFGKDAIASRRSTIAQRVPDIAIGDVNPHVLMTPEPYRGCTFGEVYPNDQGANPRIKFDNGRYVVEPELAPGEQLDYTVHFAWSAKEKNEGAFGWRFKKPTEKFSLQITEGDNHDPLPANWSAGLITPTDSINEWDVVHVPILKGETGANLTVESPHVGQVLVVRWFDSSLARV